MFQEHHGLRERFGVDVGVGRGLAQLPSHVPVGLPGRRTRAAAEPDHEADRLPGSERLGVGHEVPDTGNGPCQGGEARGRHLRKSVKKTEETKNIKFISYK